MLIVTTLLSGCGIRTHLTSVQSEQRQLQTRLDETEKNLAELKGKVAALTTRLQAMEGRLRQTFEQNQKATAIEKGASRTAEPSPTPIDAGLDIAALDAEPTDEAPEFRRGLELVRGGNYEKAIQAMRDLLRTNHDPELAASARFWMGESYLRLGQHYQAVLAFTEVHQRYPASKHASSALYKSGLGLLQLGNASEARRAFERVLSEYGSSPEAESAREKLKTLK